MLRKLRPRSIYDVMAAIACLAALAGGTAYAANEWTGANIVDGSLTGQDIFDNTVSGADITNGSLTGQDVFDNSIGGADITNGSLTGADIANESIGAADIGSQQVGPDEVINDSLLQSDIRAGAVTGDEVLDNSLAGIDINNNSLTGSDINEATLAMPPTTTATFAGPPGPVDLTDAFTKIVGRNLPAGSYAIAATANITNSLNAAQTRDAVCELRNGANFVGGATDRREKSEFETARISLSMNGGAQVPAGGGEVSLWCRYQGGIGLQTFDYGQMMIIRLDGFF
jgi:hypothetical protein